MCEVIPNIWYCCKYCKRVYQKAEDLIAHKRREGHFPSLLQQPQSQSQSQCQEKIVQKNENINQFNVPSSLVSLPTSSKSSVNNLPLSLSTSSKSSVNNLPVSLLTSSSSSSINNSPVSLPTTSSSSSVNNSKKDKEVNVVEKNIFEKNNTNDNQLKKIKDLRSRAVKIKRINKNKNKTKNKIQKLDFFDTESEIETVDLELETAIKECEETLEAEDCSENLNIETNPVGGNTHFSDITPEIQASDQIIQTDSSNLFLSLEQQDQSNFKTNVCTKAAVDVSDLSPSLSPLPLSIWDLFPSPTIPSTVKVEKEGILPRIRKIQLSIVSSSTTENEIDDNTRESTSTLILKKNQPNIRLKDIMKKSSVSLIKNRKNRPEKILCQCPICNKPVHINSKIQCHICTKWFHIYCVRRNNKHDDMNDPYELWECNACNQPAWSKSESFRKINTFDKSGKIKQILSLRKKLKPRCCYVCEHEQTTHPMLLSDEKASIMVDCDSCIATFHLNCIGLKFAPPSDEFWYCPKCRKENKKLEHEEKRKKNRTFKK